MNRSETPALARTSAFLVMIGAGMLTASEGAASGSGSGPDGRPHRIRSADAGILLALECEGRDRATGELKWTATTADPVFGALAAPCAGGSVRL